MNYRELSGVTRVLGVVKNRKVLALVGSITVAGGLVAAASGATGAYFSDTKAGTITGTIGTVKVDGGGDISFANLLPGEPQTATAKYQNTGAAPEDIWVVFPNATALSALNDLGRYGQLTITDSNTGVKFASTNLRDGFTDGDTQPGYPPVYPLHRQYLLASNVGPTVSGTMDFTFNYWSNMSDQNFTKFNTYPAPNSTTQKTILTSDGTGDGLPYQIVATQVGQTPGN